jgi:poly-gamma-glutamate synthesis protein (capsule biosynthesis protein)
MSKRGGVIFSIFLLFAICSSNNCKAQWKDTCFVDLVAVGDVMLARGVNQKIKKMGTNYPFEKTKEIVNQADVAFCNLECAVSTRAVRKSEGNVFGVKPDEAKGLSYAGSDIISLSNNHTLDKGRKGLLSTMEFLGNEGIHYVGAGKNYREANLPIILNQKGLKIAFLAYCLYPLEGIVFKEDVPAIAFFNPDRVKSTIEKLKNEVDIIIVSLHWGTEYVKSPSTEQKVIAHQIIDWGAKLILGHHPHVVQKIEEYNGGVIVYSLGNFVFDQHKPETKKSIIFKATLSKKGVNEFYTVPIRIIHFQPCLNTD